MAIREKAESPVRAEKRQHTFAFEDGLSDVNEDIQTRVEEYFRQTHQAAEEERRRRLKLHLLKPAAPKSKPSLRISLPAPAPVSSRRHPLLEELLLLQRSASLPQSPQLQPPHKALSPQAHIKDNLRMQSTLYRLCSHKRPTVS